MNNNKNRQDLFDEEFEYQDDDIQIDWSGMFHKLREKRKLFYISMPLTLIFAVIIASSIPKTYIVSTRIAPELASVNAGSSSLGGLNSLMRSFGIGSSNNTGGDAILPTLYPELMNSKTFLVSLFDIPVKSRNGKIQTAYYDYLANYQKKPWWSKAIGWVFSLIPGSGKIAEDNYKDANAAALTYRQSLIAKAISSKIGSKIDEKTGVITITVSDQDPLICTAIADSACQRLQQFITNYRTKKAYQELLNVQKQFKQAQAEYLASKREVEAFNDGNWDLVDEDFIVEKQALQNDMQLKFQTMSAFNTQLLQARSKYESLRPVYTVLDVASVPIAPAGPKKMKIILGIMFLVLFVEVVYVLRGNIKETIFGKKKVDTDSVA